MSLAAWRRCAVTMLCCVVNISVSFSTWVNVAVWAISWLESIGLRGAWRFILVTSRFRNAVWSTACIGLAELVVELGVAAGDFAVGVQGSNNLSCVRVADGFG